MAVHKNKTSTYIRWLRFLHFVHTLRFGVHKVFTLAIRRAFTKTKQQLAAHPTVFPRGDVHRA